MMPSPLAMSAGSHRSTSPPGSPSTPPEHDIYTVIVRGEEFKLTHGQISFDSPNYFLDCFSSGFAEARERVLRLDRNPSLFALIVEYLSGYPILPLTSDSLPAGMGVAMARRCLLADAQYYRLQRPYSQLTMPSLQTPLSWAGFADEMVNLRDVLASTLPDGVIQQADGSVVSTRSGNPVLIYAQDVPFRCVFTTCGLSSRSDAASRIVVRHPESFSIELSVPQHHEHSPPRPIEETSPPKIQNHAPLANLTDFDKNGILYINDSPYFLDDVFERCKFQGMSDAMQYAQQQLLNSVMRRSVVSMTDTPCDGAQYLDDRQVVYAYWADMALFTFPPSRSNQERKNVLVRAKVRSAQRVLDEVDPLADTCRSFPVQVVKLWKDYTEITGAFGPGI